MFFPEIMFFITEDHAHQHKLSLTTKISFM